MGVWIRFTLRRRSVTLTVPSLEDVDTKASSGEKQQWFTGSKWPNIVFWEEGLLRFHNYGRTMDNEYGKNKNIENFKSRNKPTLTFMNLSLEQVTRRRRRIVLVNWQWLTCSSCSSSKTLSSMARSTFQTWGRIGKRCTSTAGSQPGLFLSGGFPTLTFLSLEQVARRRSSGEKAQQSTSSSCAWISVSFSPVVLLNT